MNGDREDGQMCGDENVNEGCSVDTDVGGIGPRILSM